MEKSNNEKKYSPFANVGPHKPYEQMTNIEKKRYDKRQEYVGQILTSNQGYQFEIVDYMGYHNVLIRFLHNDYYRIASLNNLLKGEVSPNKSQMYVDKNYKYSPFANVGPQKQYKDMDANEKKNYETKQMYLGKIFTSNQGYEFQIVDYMSWHNVMVKFLYNDYYKRTDMNNVLKRAVGNPFHKNKYGGYPGVGPYNQTTHKKYHSMWFGILTRTRDEEFQSKSKYRLYRNVDICEEWLNFQNFASWLDWNFYNLNPDPDLDYQIDKDIFQYGQEKKIYSPSTCCIVPRPLNSAMECMDRPREVNLPKGVQKHNEKFTASCSFGAGLNSVYLGLYDTPEKAFQVYKEAKEGYIRELADKYLEMGAIFPATRDAIYRIDIKPFG